MAYKSIPIYNLDAQVGPQKANRTDDVKLVQGLLRLALKVIPESVTFETPQITGVFDDKTRIAIVFFQRDGNSVGSLAQLSSDRKTVESIPASQEPASDRLLRNVTDEGIRLMIW